MKIWQHTLAELTDNKKPEPDTDAPEIPMQWDADKVQPIASMPDYGTAPAAGGRGLADQVLLKRDDDCWRCVGHYVYDTIILFTEVRNTGLADILFLRCIEYRYDLPITSNFTEGGMKLLKRVHGGSEKGKAPCGFALMGGSGSGLWSQ